MTTAIQAAVARAQNDDLALGTHLASLPAKEGGCCEMFDPDQGWPDIEDDTLKAQTALMLNNTRKWMSTCNESTLAMSVGGYRDFIYPIVRASFPNNPINEIVSVQPQTRRNGTIYWMNYVIGQTRGSFKRGQTLFDANNGWQGRVGYSDERVTADAVGVTTASASVAATLAETPAVANSVEVTVVDSNGTYVVRDDGNGGFTLISAVGGAFTLSSGSVNYMTGAIALTFSSALAGSGTVSADYETNGEGQYVKAQIDIEMQSAGVKAIRRALGMRVSMESMQDFQAEFGQDLSQTIITGAAQQILADTGGEVVRDLWDMAGPTPVATFSLTVPTGVNRAEHFRDINWEIQIASGTITNATQRGEATFLIVDQNAANVLITAGAAGGFVKAGSDAKGQGLVFIGMFNDLRVYKYKFMSAFPNASANGNILVGYKGPDWWDTGYVHAPYQQFYTNGPDERADLTRRQAFAMRYAKKRINSAMYVRVAIVP